MIHAIVSYTRDLDASKIYRTISLERKKGMRTENFKNFFLLGNCGTNYNLERKKAMYRRLANKILLKLLTSRVRLIIYY